MATLNDLAISVINFGKTLERVDREIKAMNDQKPKVCLTVEEAKDIATLCGEAEFYAMQGENIKAKRHVGKARDLLVERIEQAEKQE